MKAHEIMTANPACCTPDDTVQEAARLMEQHNCGCIPVVDDRTTNRLAGIITDRDIAVRAVAQGKAPATKVGDVMSADPSACRPEDEVEEVAWIMTERRVRRVPVVDQAGCCVGMIAQADLATHAHAVDNREVGRVVECISAPTSAPRADIDVGVRP